MKPAIYKIMVLVALLGCTRSYSLRATHRHVVQGAVPVHRWRQGHACRRVFRQGPLFIGTRLPFSAATGKPFW